MNGKLNATHTHDEAALWHCEHCKSWWCSQPAVQATNFLLEVPPGVLAAFGWDNFRGWRLGGTPHVATCPQCGNVASEPRFGSAPKGAQLQVDLAALLAPILAPAG